MANWIIYCKICNKQYTLAGADSYVQNLNKFECTEDEAEKWDNEEIEKLSQEVTEECCNKKTHI